MNLRNLSPRQRRILLVVLAGGGLALIAILRRGQTASAAPDAAQLGAQATPTYGAAGTFADNGAQAAGLSSDITAGLGDVAIALEQLPDLVGTSVRENLPEPSPIQQAPAGPSPAEWATAFATTFAPIAIAATPSGQQNGGIQAAATATKSPAQTAHEAATAAGIAAEAAAVKAAKKEPGYTTTPATRNGVKGVIHHYPDGRNVFVPHKP